MNIFGIYISRSLLSFFIGIGISILWTLVNNTIFTLPIVIGVIFLLIENGFKLYSVAEDPKTIYRIRLGLNILSGFVWMILFIIFDNVVFGNITSSMLNFGLIFGTLLFIFLTMAILEKGWHLKRNIIYSIYVQPYSQEFN